MKCKWCLLTVADVTAPCPARSLVPGEKFSHEAETAGERMVRDLSRRIRVRSIYGKRKRR